VLELGDFIAGPYCAKLLRDLGADVIKVEPPEGDSSRRYGPFRGQTPDPEASGLFTFLNSSKISTVIAIGESGWRERLRSLVSEADIVIENFDPETWFGSGLSYEWFQSQNSNIILTSISPFGRQGPHAPFKGFGLQAAAGATFLQRTGDPGNSPLVLPLNNIEFNAAVHAAAATLIALRYRERGGKGQWVDIAMQHAELTATSGSVTASVVYGTQGLPKRGGNRVNTYYPYTVLPVRDGYMEFITTQDRQWKSFLQAVGDPEWSKDERFSNRVAMVQFGDELDQRMKETVGHLTREELWAICRSRRIAFQPVHRIDEVITADHMRFRNWFDETTDGRGRPVLIPGQPYRFSAMPRPPAAAPPLLPAGREELPSWPEPPLRSAHPAPLQSFEHRRARTKARMPFDPLSGIRVLDFGQVWAGPLLGCYLSDFGAEVIRVQSRASAAVQPSLGGAAGATAGDVRSYDSLTRNRRNLSLDLHNPEGREIFERLVAVSDVVINNFSPRGAEKLRLTYEHLAKFNPGIIVASLSAAGTAGPWSDLVTYGPSLSALYGIKSLLGYPGDARVLEDGAHLDPAAATHGCVAVLAALRWRELTGQGQLIDLAQGEAALTGFAEAIIEFGLNQSVPAPTGNRHRMMAPSGVYRARGDDSWIAISTESDGAWRALMDVLGSPELAFDSRFKDLAARLRNHDNLDSEINKRTVVHDAWELTLELQRSGVASYPVLDVYGALNDPQLQFRRGMANVEAPGVRAEDLSTVTPWLFTKSPPSVKSPTADVGEHNREVLAEVLGMTPREIEEAISSGALE
jgi:crotonobetainyl-CoA:carnitine CoA-transferase CaiB-like acyl-CoA transferase